MYVLDIIVLQNSSTVTFATAATTRSTTTTTIRKRANVINFLPSTKTKNKKFTTTKDKSGKRKWK